MKFKQILNQIKVSISGSKASRQDIDKIAFKLYNNRQITEKTWNDQQDWLKAEEIANNPLRLLVFKCNQPLIKTEKKFLEPVLDYLKRLALLEILELLGNISLLVGVIVFIAGEEDRRNSEIYQAWQVITAAYNQAGSGGRIQALEFLNSEPKRISRLWLLTWDRESLRGLEAPKAYLREVQLSNADLANANLQEANLRKADLQEANLREANLREANLREANLQGAYLQRTDLHKTDLEEANLQGANLQEANLQGADLQGANLQEAFLGKGYLAAFYQEANLQKANLQGANLQRTYLDGVNLQEADLQGANLQEADLQEANLQEADLQGVNLQEANLKYANLRKANLEDANLQGVNLEGANLEGANLQSANLEGANLEKSNLKNVLYSDKTTLAAVCTKNNMSYPCPTIFPKDFDPKAAGMKLIKDLKDIPTQGNYWIERYKPPSHWSL
ncbi:pentapeptide repeat-containing protein [Moorena sp. SIOASIH]|uniref:pentapeptide repeat-containing protein n=1 Tax=Moorena sp. SIOASIH TaxID=2607817 RepID=UPI0025D03C4D|nr:pentapeptide repeat-containing protein [Moorena sp. SIOASIH]